MNDHLDRIVDRKKRRGARDQIASDEAAGDRVEHFDAIERIGVFLELIDHAETRAQTLAGMSGTALGVFFAAFIAAFVVESGHPSAILEIADLISEIFFVTGAFLLLRCIFQSLRPSQIQDPWDENELEVYWRRLDHLHANAARNFWLGTVLLALSISILVIADILIDVGAFPSVISP
ncbi:MAG: hypothetical protein ACE5HA_15365 [Anaerolineae bacterium]